MGEHKFVVGMRVGIKKSFPEDNIRRDDVLRLLEKDGDNFKTMVERTGESIAVWIGFLEPLPADPPSVGVPAKGTVVETGWIRPFGYAAQQQMAAQQQGQDRRTEETKLADDLCEFLHPFAGETGQNEGARDTLGRLVGELRASRAAWTATQKPGDVLGERDRLRREKADLETQVAYLTRELVLARGKMKGAR